MTSGSDRMGSLLDAWKRDAVAPYHVEPTAEPLHVEPPTRLPRAPRCGECGKPVETDKHKRGVENVTYYCSRSCLLDSYGERYDEPFNARDDRDADYDGYPGPEDL